MCRRGKGSSGKDIILSRLLSRWHVRRNREHCHISISLSVIRYVFPPFPMPNHTLIRPNSSFP
jgi:hypothetical protein